jgi:predicted transcriptional regulator
VTARWNHLAATRYQPPLLTAPPEPPALHQVGEQRYQQVLSLAQAGWSREHIAEHIGVGKRTVSRWLAQQRGPHTGPRRARRHRHEGLVAAVRASWEAGEQNGTVIWQALQAQGFTVSRASVFRYRPVSAILPKRYVVPYN